MNPVHACIKELLQILRAEGITAYEGPTGALGTVKVVFGDKPIVSETENARSPLLEVPDKAKVGSDGLTASEQIEYYGQVLDAPRE